MMIILSSWPRRWWRVLFIVTISRILLLLLVVMRWRIAMSITVIVHDMSITLVVNNYLFTLLPREPLK
jgi:hypothetical protein